MESLKTVGLSKNEIKAFKVLLKKQRISAPDISKKSGVPPTKIYSVLNKMIRKGIVEKVSLGLRDNQKYYYSLINPEFLTKKWINKKQNEIEELSETLQKAMQIYRENVNLKVDSWTLDYAQRISKFKEIAQKTEKNALLMERGVEHLHLFWPFVRKKINIKMIVPISQKESIKNILGDKIKYFTVDLKFFEKYPTFCVLDDKYAFIFTRRESYGIFSENQRMINIFKKMFEIYIKSPEMLEN
ncbi:MAG: winged helix-turn-helix transcriptional regulator [Candidatus Aenigmarchaeota archaeon]|nr:winged helix-turn-helix transcriptional regulator [Candidatus Aenigmarchaeota archaeon]